MLKDFEKLLQVTRDERFVTARHTFQAIWKVGLAGEKQRKLLLDGLGRRFKECARERNCTLIRYDINVSLGNLYDAVKDEEIKTQGAGLERDRAGSQVSQEVRDRLAQALGWQGGETTMAEKSLYIYKIQAVRQEMVSEGRTPEEDHIVGEHFSYLERLTKQGVVLLAGRTLTDDYAGFGIIIFSAEFTAGGGEDRAQRPGSGAAGDAG